MAASSTLVTSLQRDFEEACTSIGSLLNAAAPVSSVTSSSTTHAAVALQRNRDLHTLLQRLLSLHAQLPSIVSPFFLSQNVLLSHCPGPAAETEPSYSQREGGSKSCSRQCVLVRSPTLSLTMSYPRVGVLLSCLKPRNTSHCK